MALGMKPPPKAPKPTTTAKGPKNPAISRSGLNRNTSTVCESKAPSAGPPNFTGAIFSHVFARRSALGMSQVKATEM